MSIHYDDSYIQYLDLGKHWLSRCHILFLDFYATQGIIQRE